MGSKQPAGDTVDFRQAIDTAAGAGIAVLTLAPEETRLRKDHNRVAVPKCMDALLYTF